MERSAVSIQLNTFLALPFSVSNGLHLPICLNADMSTFRGSDASSASSSAEEVIDSITLSKSHRLLVTCLFSEPSRCLLVVLCLARLYYHHQSKYNNSLCQPRSSIILYSEIPVLIRHIFPHSRVLVDGYKF